MEEHTMIPKKIFFFWGNEQMSWMRYMTLKSFRMFNPTWEMTLYISHCPKDIKTWVTPENQDFFCFKGENYIQLIGELSVKIVPWDISNNGVTAVAETPNISASHRSNFFKWAKLATEGGIYSDLDIIYFRPMDDFYNILSEGGYDTAICQTEYLSIGLLASAGDNPFFRDLFLNGLNRYNAGEYQSAGVSNIYDFYSKPKEKEEAIAMIREKYPQLSRHEILINCPPSRVIDVAQAKYPHLKFYNIPMGLVYPMDSTQVEHAFNTDFNVNTAMPYTIGYHWYAGHPISQNFNNLLTHKNYKDICSVFTNIAKHIL